MKPMTRFFAALVAAALASAAAPSVGSCNNPQDVAAEAAQHSPAKGIDRQEAEAARADASKAADPAAPRPAEAANAPKPAGPVALPNPMVEYGTLAEARAALGFSPLALPKITGYECDGIFVIDGRLADLRYRRRWEPEVELQLRTYRLQEKEPGFDISGIQGAQWQTEDIAGQPLLIARPEPTVYAATWGVGRYLFSVRAENMSYLPFHILVVDGLMEMSSNFFAQ